MLHRGVADQILELLEADEALGPRILQLHRQGFFEKDAAGVLDEKVDGEAPFPRGVTHHNRLALRNLDHLFRELGLQPETVDSICSKSKLQSCRWLWCWFNDCETQDKLPAGTLNSLLSWSLQRQQELVTSRLEAFVLDEGDSIDWLLTGVFTVTFEDGVTTITHQPSSNSLVNPSCFNGVSVNWTIDGNYSTKCAKLKNLDNGAVFPLALLFRENGHILQNRSKSTKISPRAKAGPTDGLPVASPAKSQDGSQNTTVTSSNMLLTQGSDGRYRLQAPASTRLAEPAPAGAASPPSLLTRGLAAKSRARPEGTAEHVRPSKLEFPQETRLPDPSTPPRGKKTKDINFNSEVHQNKGSHAKSSMWSDQDWEGDTWAGRQAEPRTTNPAAQKHGPRDWINDFYDEEGEEEFPADDVAYHTGHGVEEVFSTTLHHRRSKTSRRANWHSTSSPPHKRRRILRRASSTGSLASSER